MKTPETSKAWDDASKSPDGTYYSTVRYQDMAAAMLNHSRKMERERNEARKKFWNAINKYGHAQQDAFDARAQRDALAELLRCIDETLETLEGGVPDQEGVAIAVIRGEIARQFSKDTNIHTTGQANVHDDLTRKLDMELRYATIEIAELRRQIRETIMENLHLADGDDCTLKRLKDAIDFELPPENA